MLIPENLASRWFTRACILIGFAIGWTSLSAQSPQGLSLHDAVQQALRSPQTTVLDSQVEQTQGLVRQARLRPNPRLYVQSEDLRPWDDSFTFADHTEDYAYLGQTIEVDGKRSKRVALATAQLQQAQAYRILRVRQLVGRVSSAYWMAVSQKQVVDLLTEDLNVVDEMVQYHKARVDAGAMRGVDLLRMQIERDRLAVALRSAQRDAQQARLELFKQMGIAPSDVPLTDTLNAVPDVQPLSTDAVLAQRPDIAATRSAVQSAQADLRLQRANAIPDPDFFGGYKRNTGDNTAYGALQLSLPFASRNQGEIQRAQASVTTTQAQLSVLEQQVSTEMRQAYENYLAQRDIVEKVLPDMRQRSRQNLDIVREAYRIGGTDLLRFIDAERTEFDVELSSVRAMAQLQENAIQLRLAYGVQP